MMFDLTYENIMIFLFTNFWFVTLISVCVILSAFMLWFFMYHLKPYKAIILRKQGEIYVKLKEVRFSKTAETFKHKKKEFPINLKLVSYLNEHTPIMFVDFDSGEILTFNKVETMNPEMLDLFLDKKIVAMLASRLGGLSFNWIFLIIMLSLGVFIGIVLQPYLPIPPIQNATAKVSALYGIAF